jgi:mannosyltransferase OCH1-like enzyme
MKFSIKRVLSILLVIMLVVCAIKANKIKKYFIEERYRALLSDLHITNRCYSPNQDLLAVMQQNDIDYIKSDTQVVKNSLSQLLSNEIDNNAELKIPAITHHIYFTYEKDPLKLKDFFIEKMKANFSKLNDLDQEWEHYIWTNNASLFPPEIIKIKGVKLMNTSEFMYHKLYNHLTEAINNGNNLRAYFMEASDMLRLMALQKFGGIYNDMDYEIYNAPALLSLMKKFDFIGGRELVDKYSYYGNAFMVAKAHHPVIERAVNTLISYDENPESLPLYMKQPCNLLEKLYFTSPPLLTVAYLKENNLEGNLDIILPSWMVFNVNFARQKNGGCAYSDMSAASFRQHDINLANIIESFTLESEKSLAKKPDDNIYYNLNVTKDRKLFPMIGADMFCATWYENRK